MSNPVKILTFENQIESILLSEILTERKIPHIIRTYQDSAYNGLWQTKTVWGHIEAPEEYRKEIQDIFREMSV
jgi:hypothetical protein